MFVISPDHWPFRGGASDWVNVVSNCTMGRIWTQFPTQLRVGIVIKEAVASHKQCHGAISHSTDPPTPYWVYFSIPNMVWWPLCMITSDKQISRASLFCKQNSSPSYSLCVDILFNSGALGIYVRKLRNKQFQNKAWW